MAPKAKTFLNNIYTIFNKDDDIDVPVRIFKVPNSLCSGKPEAYVPQLVGLGPYRHFRPELQQMQTYKLAEAKKIRKGFRNIGFQQLVELLGQLTGSSIRASYDTFLDMEDEILACIMSIDGLFLFELLCFYGISRDVLANSEFFCDLVKSAGRRLAQDSIVRDAMIVENQIPILILKVILIIECTQVVRKDECVEVSHMVSELFPRIMLGFCKALSPLDLLDGYPLYKALKHAHLLDLLYHLIVLKDLPETNADEEEEEKRFIEETSNKVMMAFKPASHMKLLSFGLDAEEELEQFIDVIEGLVPEDLIKPIKLLQGLLGLPASTLWSSLSSSAPTRAPCPEDILIPTASQLRKAGVKFCHSANNHITTIMFDLNTTSFHLPSIKLDVNSEVILRNLVAYEAMIKSETESLILTRYLELMNGLVETAGDVKVLKNHGIILLESINDEEAAKLFNGMSKSIRLTNTPELDIAMEDVKSYYSGLWKVSASKFIKKWKQNIWIFGKVLAVLIFMLLMAIQTFCSVYECPRLSFKTTTSQQDFLELPSLRASM